MVALPIPRAPSAPAPRGDWIDTLDSAWEDPSLEALDLLCYAQLRRWLALHPGWWPSAELLGRLIRRSRQTAARCLAALVRTGYVHQRADGGYDLGSPAPGLAREPSTESQGTLFGATPATHARPPVDVSRPPVSGNRPPVDGVPLASPPAPPRIEESSKKSSTTTEEVDRLIRRAAVLFGEVASDPSLVTESLTWIDLERLALALDLAELRASGSNPVRTWWGLVAILKDWAGRPVESLRAKVDAARPRKSPPTQQWNHNPGPKIAPTPPEERADWHDWRRAFREIDAEKKPASGSHANDPPTPAPEMFGCSAPAESYPPVRGETRPESQHSTPQRAGREASPRTAFNPARTPEKTAKQGIPQAPQIYVGVTSHECSHDSGQRARQDSNLQPSDSKSAGLPGPSSGPRAPTAQADATPPSGATARPFPHPSSDAPGYGPDKPPGSDIRRAMRC